MKRIIALILVVLMTLTIVGCSDENANSSANSESNQSNTTESLSSSNKQPTNNNESSNNSVTTPINDTVKCEINVINDQYYIVPIANYVSSNTGSGMRDLGIDFKSMDEFIKTVKSGNFTRGQYDTMIDFFKKDEIGRIKICNIDKTYEPVAPKKFSTTGVYWQGEKYSQTIQAVEDWWAQFTVHSKESFESRSEFYWKRYGFGREFDKSKKYPDYAEVNYQTDVVDVKLKRYTLETNVATYEKASAKTQMYIEEKYYLRSESPNFPTSNEIPYLIQMFVENDDLQYEVRIDGIKSPVTPEWLMQFGLKPRS